MSSELDRCELAKRIDQHAVAQLDIDPYAEFREAHGRGITGEIHAAESLSQLLAGFAMGPFLGRAGNGSGVVEAEAMFARKGLVADIVIAVITIGKGIALAHQPSSEIITAQPAHALDTAISTPPIGHAAANPPAIDLLGKFSFAIGMTVLALARRPAKLLSSSKGHDTEDPNGPLADLDGVAADCDGLATEPVFQDIKRIAGAADKDNDQAETSEEKGDPDRDLEGDFDPDLNELKGRDTVDAAVGGAIHQFRSLKNLTYTNEAGK